MTDEIQKSLRTEVEAFKQTQKVYHKALHQRKQLDGQLNVNQFVKKELDLLKSENEVFKLIGPVLVKQDIVEAKQNVTKRIEYISSELKRVEDMIVTLEKKQDAHGETIEKYQNIFREAQLKALSQAKA